ncbi:MAG: L,D-transpeptidase family protein [Anaerolineae bacterium]|nr:L,D-transpeptidase family protein [Anaerolineae bacterium]
MSSYNTEQKRGRARDRIAARQRRRTPMAVRSESISDTGVRERTRKVGGQWNARLDNVRLFLAELWWRTTHTPQALYALGGILVLGFVIFVLSHVLGGRIFPNVWALGVNIGGMTTEEAAQQLETVWQRNVRISLTDADRSWAVSPDELGLGFDARATAEAARGVGMSGLPFGMGIQPKVNLNDELRAQTYLLDLSLQANVAPYNAGYRWEGDEIVSVAPSEGKTMDVAATLSDLKDMPQAVVEARRLDLVMSPVAPSLQDADRYLEDARALTSQPFQLVGYDPFTDESITWSTDRDTFTSWIEAGSNGLDLRADAFRPFLDAQARTLNEGTDNGLRFIEPTDVTEKMREAIQVGVPDVVVRIRYRSTTYEVVRGDTGNRIARRTGIPFFLIQQANPNLDFDTTTLYVGDKIQLPSRDLVLPIDPVPGKRIVVNLNTQSLVAYENGVEVFNWLISSGMSDAPTSPGIFQIQSHEDVASGSSFTLCGDRGCGQWQMYYFMGIYEVIPGLMNGFHGAVLLPNGAYLGGGNVGQPYTFGCIMSRDDQAQELYHWASDGTVVEIISSEFQPESEIGRLAAQETGGI